jgi:hypothetical protein
LILSEAVIGLPRLHLNPIGAHSSARSPSLSSQTNGKSTRLISASSRPDWNESRSARAISSSVFNILIGRSGQQVFSCASWGCAAVTHFGVCKVLNLFGLVFFLPAFVSAKLLILRGRMVALTVIEWVSSQFSSSQFSLTCSFSAHLVLPEAQLTFCECCGVTASLKLPFLRSFFATSFRYIYLVTASRYSGLAIRFRPTLRRRRRFPPHPQRWTCLPGSPIVVLGQKERSESPCSESAAS